MKAFLRNAIILVALVIIDQLIKWWFAAKRAYLDLGFAVLHYVTNTGASFGMLHGNNTLLAWFSIIVLGIIMSLADKIRKEQVLSVIIIISGLIGNFIDRLFRGFVVDFVDLKFWPVFNLADSLVVIGVIWLGIVILGKDVKEIKKRDKRETKGKKKK